ncbi:MAG TPA: hypothetical protein DDZ81_04815 [Acetobacteraceae bacterium]|nr:hypothetical protein [Acetobacteraceae bacterium]
MKLSRGRVVAAVAAVLIVGGWAVWHPSIAPVEGRAAFPPEQIARGAELAAVGDCGVCHTTDGSRPYASGRGVPTPFGVVYATNITSDPDTGIGKWSEAAFRRAMRDGIDREGRHLYPVLPYPHFTRATDQDIAAMYAFLMTRAPVHADAPPNQLPFPLNQRVVLAGWNLLYLSPGPWRADPAHDADWNRGAYLVEAIGHCGACHTPRNVLGAEKGGQALSGGEAENWYAPPLQAASPAREAWTVDSLATYLHTGFDAHHGAAAGPMTAVTDELAKVPAADVRAMAVYLASMMPNPAPVSVVVHDGANPVFAGACGGCHGVDAPMTRSGAPSLALSTAVNAPTPRGVIQVILRGLPWREGQAAPYMPSFASALTDGQVADLAAYLRSTYSDKPAWSDLPAEVAKIRGAS